jgi:tRNA pseudouridine38-40 synthase
MRLKLTLQYTGTGLYGWQAQSKPRKLPTVQGHLIDAFKSLKVQASEPVAAGRTDAGVHALGQTVHVDVEKRLELIKFWGGLNRFMPDSIRVTRVAEVENDFHARFSALQRHYRYLIYTGRDLPPHLVGKVGHVRNSLNFKIMNNALKKLKYGEHDFSAFRDAECQSRTPICRLITRKLLLTRDALGTPLIAMDIAADHFLHHMVRNIVGTLVEVGEGKRNERALVDLIKTKDRKLAGMTFSPDGLYFMAVKYPRHKELDVVGK